MAQTIPTIINMGKISTYECANDTSNGALYGSRLDPNLFRLIYLEMKSLEWAYLQSPTYTNIEAVANYNVALYGKYGIQAISILNGGSGGTIVPVSPTTAPSPIEFEVGASSYIITGQSTKILPADFLNYNLIFVRNGIGQAMINLGGTYYTWDKATRAFECFGVANEGEQFQLIPYL